MTFIPRLMSTFTIITIMFSVARLVEEPDLLPALVATVSRHLVNYPNPARCYLILMYMIRIMTMMMVCMIMTMMMTMMTYRPGRQAFSPTDKDKKPVVRIFFFILTLITLLFVCVFD